MIFLVGTTKYIKLIWLSTSHTFEGKYRAQKANSRYRIRYNKTLNEVRLHRQIQQAPIKSNISSFTSLVREMLPSEGTIGTLCTGTNEGDQNASTRFICKCK